MTTVNIQQHNNPHWTFWFQPETTKNNYLLDTKHFTSCVQKFHFTFCVQKLILLFVQKLNFSFSVHHTKTKIQLLHTKTKINFCTQKLKSNFCTQQVKFNFCTTTKTYFAEESIRFAWDMNFCLIFCIFLFLFLFYFDLIFKNFLTLVKKINLIALNTITGDDESGCCVGNLHWKNK